MKKILLLISRYFSNFLSVLLIFCLFLVYIMFKVPIYFWVGNMAGRNFTDNVGGLLVKFLENNYLIFFLFPFLPFLGGFFILSMFIWIYYRNDKEVGKVGFKNVVLCLLIAFTLFYLPIRGFLLDFKIQEQRDKQISEIYNDKTVYVNKGISKEFLKLYQTLADEGIQEWRKDPIAVVKNELEKGDLSSLSFSENKLTLKSKDDNTVTVELENDKLKAEISLNQYRKSGDGIWLVRSYRKVE